MPKLYIACSLIALALYGTAQVRGWSLFGSDAAEFQRLRAERADALRGTRSGGGGIFSGHK
ncbi:MAG TPA: hypothetical protein PLK52_00300 [Usitatibacteraceae bacterium]|nr:hypothetical protein [Burkholderiales bacterium]MBZ0250960.1 hypothetical protein [Burkholderiales bacterium]MCL4690562.1 hypothetical protein [Burkholderiales bacterium]HRA21960.1 hypothetical protein [Usitatibacteraceae bacterium]